MSDEVPEKPNTLDSLERIFRRPDSDTASSAESDTASSKPEKEVELDIPSSGGEDCLPICATFQRCLGSTSDLLAVELDLPLGFVMEESEGTTIYIPPVFELYRLKNGRLRRDQ